MSQTHERRTSESPPGTPRWVKVLGILTLVLVLVLVIVQFTMGGSHGPWRHLPSGDTSGVIIPVNMKMDHTAFAGGHT